MSDSDRVMQHMKVPDAWRRNSLEGDKLNRLSACEPSKVAQKLIERASEIAIASTVGDREALAARSAELLKTLAIVLAQHGLDLGTEAEKFTSETPREG